MNVDGFVFHHAAQVVDVLHVVLDRLLQRLDAAVADRFVGIAHDSHFGVFTTRKSTDVRTTTASNSEHRYAKSFVRAAGTLFSSQHFAGRRAGRNGCCGCGQHRILEKFTTILLRHPQSP
jgi:hypothetical protein